MSDDPEDDPRSVAITQLEWLGFSTYAARTFVALAALGEGTAQDVSEIADVPRTRVYDAVDELQEHGLADVQQSTPKRFWVISAETTGRYFEQKFTRRIHELVDALDALEPRSRSDEQRGVWTVIGRDAITRRVVDFVEDATDEVVFMTVSELLTPDIVDSLREASDRGVSIELGAMEDPVEERLHTEIPDAEVFDSLWAWSETSAGRMLMVDEEHTLVSVLVPDENAPPEQRDETAIWGSGETNSLVVVLKVTFAWRLEEVRE